MASRARTKRLAREVPELRKKNSSYFVNIDDQNLTSFHAYIMGPDDSCYAGKLVKLKIEVPVEYPYKPPKCTFVQQRGGRIHPNLYNEGGKVCLSILVRICICTQYGLNLNLTWIEGNVGGTRLGLYDDYRHRTHYHPITSGCEAFVA